MEYMIHIAILVLIYIILSSSLNLLSGCVGLLSVCHAASYGFGAYIAAILAVRVHCSFSVSLLSAAVFCMVLGALVGLPVLRIRGDYFAIATLGFQVITFNVLNNWTALTGGAMGLPGIPQPEMFGVTVSSRGAYLLLVSAVAFCAVFVCFLIVNSPYGRMLRAIREDELFAQAMGKRTNRHKFVVFVLGSALAGVAGVLYAYYFSYIDPGSFTVTESIAIVSMVIIGGSGSFWGPIVGATVLTVLPELLRFVGLPISMAANMKQIMYGALLIAFLMLRPQGIVREPKSGERAS